MALRQILRPTNRRVRYLVGLLLVGLFCIQCIPSNDSGQGQKLIAKGLIEDPAEKARKVIHLAQTDQIALLEFCQANYVRSYRDYTCTLLKKERINGQLGAEQRLHVKFRGSPFSVAMAWDANSPIGDRVLYVEGKYNGNMVVRPKGKLLQLLTKGSVLRQPDGAEAMRTTLRPVNLFGFQRGMNELIKVYRQAQQAGDLKMTFGKYATVAGRRTFVLERYLPPKNDYPAAKTLVYIDEEYLVPICIEGFDWEQRLTSRYLFKDIRFNVGLTDDDFLPEANGISLPAGK
jgi:hypothetical protein